jgi:hypothetical protein
MERVERWNHHHGNYLEYQLRMEHRNGKLVIPYLSIQREAIVMCRRKKKRKLVPRVRTVAPPPPIRVPTPPAEEEEELNDEGVDAFAVPQRDPMSKEADAALRGDVLTPPAADAGLVLNVPGAGVVVGAGT